MMLTTWKLENDPPKGRSNSITAGLFGVSTTRRNSTKGQRAKVGRLIEPLKQQHHQSFEKEDEIFCSTMKTTRHLSVGDIRTDKPKRNQRSDSSSSQLCRAGSSNELSTPKRRHTFCYFRSFRKTIEYSKEIKFVNNYAYFEHRWHNFTKTYEIQHPGTQRKIVPHQYTNDPPVAWEMLKVKRPVRIVRQMKLDSPIKFDQVRFVCIGCLHGLTLDPSKVPAGDILIVPGDFTSCGLPNEIKAFNDFLGQLKHSFKVVIAGNSDCTFDEHFLKSSENSTKTAKEMALKETLNAAMSATKVSSAKALLTNAIYLQDSMVELFGLQIYGTPWQPTCDNWTFSLPRGQPLLDKWNQIPSGIDVLVTHTPPLGHGDFGSGYARFGCVELLNSVVGRIRPKYHVFAHIHSGYGCTSDGYTKFINCSLLNENSKLHNSPIIFDIAVNTDTKAQFLHRSKKLMKRLSKK